MTDPTCGSAAPPVVSQLKFSEALSLLMQLRARADADWYRVIYLHAALIGAMIFFAGQSELFLTGRAAVFVFYTVNLIVSYGALKESYDGLRVLTRDLRAYPPSPSGGEIQGWMATRIYRHDLWVRTGLLVIVWLVVGVLLLGPLAFGRASLP